MRIQIALPTETKWVNQIRFFAIRITLWSSWNYRCVWVVELTRIRHRGKLMSRSAANFLTQLAHYGRHRVGGSSRWNCQFIWSSWMRFNVNPLWSRCWWARDKPHTKLLLKRWIVKSRQPGRYLHTSPTFDKRLFRLIVDYKQLLFTMNVFNFWGLYVYLKCIINMFKVEKSRFLVTAEPIYKIFISNWRR